MAYLNVAAGKARESGSAGGGVLANAGVPGVGTSEVQTVATTGTPTGGTFKLAFEGRATGTITHTSSAAAIQSALELLPNIGTGGVVCAGGPLPTGVTVTFSGSLARRAVPLLTLFSNDLTGGTTPTVTVTETTPGVDATYRDAPVGSVVTDVTNAKLYIKGGTMAAPVYTVVGTQV